MTEKNKQVFTCEEAAQSAAISLAMVRKLIRTGKLRAVRIGRCVRVPASELDRIVHEGTTKKKGTASMSDLWLAHPSKKQNGGHNRDE
jgi:excisionase family DNA binding protein